MLKDDGVSKCSSGHGKIILSPSMAGEEAITSEEADLAEVAPPAPLDGVSKCSSKCGKIILSPLMAGEEAITSEEADLTKVAAPAPLEISEGVNSVKEEEVNNVTSNTTCQPSIFDPVEDDSPI